MDLLEQINNLFKSKVSKLEDKIKALELQLKKANDSLKDMMDTALREHISCSKLQTEIGELKTKNNNQSMNLAALRASSKTEIKKLKYQLHMANNRIQVLDTELQANKFDSVNTNLRLENLKLKNILYPKEFITGAYVKYIGDKEELYGVLFKIRRIKPNGETVLAFASKNTTGYQNCIDGIKLSDLILFDLITNLPQ